MQRNNATEKLTGTALSRTPLEFPVPTKLGEFRNILAKLPG
jgi:hypothetical protein